MSLGARGSRQSRPQLLGIEPHTAAPLPKHSLLRLFASLFLVLFRGLRGLHNPSASHAPRLLFWYFSSVYLCPCNFRPPHLSITPSKTVPSAFLVCFSFHESSPGPYLFLGEQDLGLLASACFTTPLCTLLVSFGAKGIECRHRHPYVSTMCEGSFCQLGLKLPNDIPLGVSMKVFAELIQGKDPTLM